MKTKEYNFLLYGEKEGNDILLKYLQDLNKNHHVEVCENVEDLKENLNNDDVDILLFSCIKNNTQILEQIKEIKKFSKFTPIVLFYLEKDDFLSEENLLDVADCISLDNVTSSSFNRVINYTIQSAEREKKFVRSLEQQKLLNDLMRFSLLNNPLSVTLDGFLKELLNNKYLSYVKKSAIYIQNSTSGYYELASELGYGKIIPHNIIITDSKFEDEIKEKRYLHYIECCNYIVDCDHYFHLMDNDYLVPIKGDGRVIGLILFKFNGSEKKLVQNFVFFRVVARTLAMVITRKWAERSFRKLSSVVEQNNSAVIITDTEGIVEYVNPNYLEMTGYTKEELLGKSVAQLPQVKRYRDVYLYLQERLSNGKIWQTEFKSIRKNGESFWERATFSPIKDSTNRITHFFKVSENITTKKQTEDALKESEERYRTLVNNINEYIYSVTFNKKGTISSYHSPRAKDITGYTPEDFAQDPDLWYNMIYDEDKERVLDFQDSLHHMKIHAAIEHRLVRKDGEIRWVNNSCAVRELSDGSLRTDGFILDVSDRREREEELRKLSRAVEQSPASVIITDKNGEIEYINTTFSEETGYTLRDVAGKTPRILKSGHTTRDEYEKLWDTISKGGEWKGEFLNKKKNGELFWEIASICAIKNSRNEITHYLSVEENITERKKTEEALKVSEDMLRRRNEGMERELKYAQMINRTLLPSEPVKNKKIHIDYRYFPLEAVGGDFFSFDALNEEDYGIFIGDVSGHGVSAALYLSLLNYLTHNIRKNCGYEPSEYLSALNDQLFMHMSAYFMTAVYGVFKFTEEKTEFSFSNGGHPAIIVYRKQDNSVFMMNSKGTILGSFSGMEYPSKKIELYSGDRLFLYTDGVIETVNSDKEMLGSENFLDIILKSGKIDNLSDSLDQIYQEINNFRNEEPIEDDIVLIGCEIL